VLIFDSAKDEQASLLQMADILRPRFASKSRARDRPAGVIPKSWVVRQPPPSRWKSTALLIPCHRLL
jgi:hypothetical protein